MNPTDTDPSKMSGDTLPDTATLTQHPIATIIPAPTADEFDEILADIKAHGLLQPIVLFEGMVLEGWTRFRCCQRLGISLRTEPFTGIDPRAYVISLNVKRRHLTPSQRAAIVADLATFSHGGDRSNGSRDPSAKTIAEVAREAQISPATMKRFRYVREHGTPKEIAAVKAGTMTVTEATQAIRDREARESAQTTALVPTTKPAPAYTKPPTPLVPPTKPAPAYEKPPTPLVPERTRADAAARMVVDQAERFDEALRWERRDDLLADAVAALGKAADLKALLIAITERTLALAKAIEANEAKAAKAAKQSPKTKTATKTTAKKEK
jgi:hypothetical protein